MANSNDIPEGYKATELGALPLDWQIKKIGELFSVQQGISMSKARRDGPNKHPFLRTLNVFWKGIDLTTLDYMDFSEREIEKLNLLLGDLLVCEGGDIGRTAMWRGELESCGYQNHLHRLRVKSNDVNPEFVMFWMQAAMEILGYYREEGNNTTIPNLSQSRLKNFDIPLPPLPEQRAIAATLRTVQEAKEKTDAVIAATKALKAAMMKHLFTYGPVPPEEAEKVALKETEIGAVPDGWDIVNLGEISEFLQYGTSKKCDYDVKGYPVLRIPNIMNGIINCSDLKFLEITNEDFDKIKLKIGDILFVRTNGVRNLVGRCAIYQGEPEESLFASYLIRVRLKSDQVLPAFVQYYSETPSGREFLSGQASGSADGKFNINTQTIKSVVLPLPDIKIQKKIVEIISSIDQKLAAEQSRKEALDTLFTSLLHDLMTAKIRVNPVKTA